MSVGTRYFRVAAVGTSGVGELSSEISARSLGGQVATPSFGVAAGSYTSAQSVSLSTGTAGAAIRYTTDGSTPSSTVGTVYSGPVSISAEGSTTLKAIAYLADYLDSSLASATYVIDSTAPGSPSVLISSGAAYSGTTSVTLSLSASDATEMYVSNTSGCASGGSWESVTSTKSWTLGQSNATATVYAKFRDALGNTTSCVSDTIVVDEIDPLAPTFAPGSQIFLLPSMSLLVRTPALTQTFWNFAIT